MVVLLPKERIVITGDFLTSGLSNMSDSYPNEWAASLKQVDMTKHQGRLPIQGPGIPLLAARRIYELLDGAR
jgi:hypothetical protein